jgi:hypothetical protein
MDEHWDISNVTRIYYSPLTTPNLRSSLCSTLPISSGPARLVSALMCRSACGAVRVSAFQSEARRSRRVAAQTSRQGGGRGEPLLKPERYSGGQQTECREGRSIESYLPNRNENPQHHSCTIYSLPIPSVASNVSRSKRAAQQLQLRRSYN